MKFKILYVIIFAVLMSSCREDFNKPIEENAPEVGQISDVSVQNTPGGAIITYKGPSSDGFSYVLAELEYEGGKVRQFKSSQYKNHVVIDGIGNTGEYIIKLYSVNRSEKKSNPVDVAINPLTPPFLEVFKSIELIEDFGGVNLKFNNETEADLAFVLYTTDSTGIFSQYGTYYSKQRTGSYTFRGMKSEEVKIGLFIKDRWENSSDTLLTHLTPLYEVMVPKPYADVTLDNDAILFEPTGYLGKQFLWDNDWPTVYGDYGSYRHMATSDSELKESLHITIDLRKSSRLSRMRLNQYYGYSNKSPRKYEIWGHPGTPSQDGSWDGWVLLAEHENVKPSGATSPVTDEDKAAWLNGDNISFPTDIPSIRYIRIKSVENWLGLLNMSIAEVTFWGGSND